MIDEYRQPDGDTPQDDDTNTAEHLLTAALRALQDTEAILVNLTDPTTRAEISEIMSEHNNDQSGYGGWIDQVQFLAATIRHHLNQQ